MRERLIWAIAAGALAGGVAIGNARGTQAETAPAALLEGCGDVPEAVALAEHLRLRGIAIDRALADLDRRKQELAAAENRIRTRLEALKAAKAALADGKAAEAAGTAGGIERLIAVYDAMKPAEAAPILAGLPPDFAAEILARVQPDAGARIIARIAPDQAAVLTAHMASRRPSGD